jgi:chemotaxis protein CheD
MRRLKSSNLMVLFLQPGEVLMADASCQLRTLLGSCVSITLWHPGQRIGGMSHFLLPTQLVSNKKADPSQPGYYGDEALRLMLQEMKKSGVAPDQCQGKIFGGGNMFPDQARRQTNIVGQHNGHAARALLQQYGVPLVAESLFGIGYRQIIFDVKKGDVWSKQVQASDGEIEIEKELVWHASK